MGLYLLFRARKQHRTPMYLIGVTCILLGIGSFIFHSSGTFFGEVIDNSGMFLISALMVTMEARRLWKMTIGQLALCFSTLTGLSVLLVLAFHSIGITIFGIQIAIVYFANIYWKLWRGASSRDARWRRHRGELQCFERRVDHRHAFRLGVTFLGALAIWVLDLTGVVCSPSNHVFNGHAMWHALTAVCLYFFYRHHEQFVPIDARFAASEEHRQMSLSSSIQGPWCTSTSEAPS